MNPQNLKKLLDDLHKQKLTPHQAMAKLETLPYEDLEFAKVDHHMVHALNPDPALVPGCRSHTPLGTIGDELIGDATDR